MYLVFSLVMFFIGGAMALVIRAELFQPGLQLVDPGFFNTDDHRARADHGVRRGHAGDRGPRQLDDPAADRRARHGAAAHEQLQLLAAGRGVLAADPVAVHAGRRSRRGLDAVPAAGAADRRRAAARDLRDPPGRRLVDHGRDQHHRDDHEHARPGHDAAQDAAVRLDLADHRLPADRRDAGVRRRRDDAAHRPLLRHQLLQRGGRRRPGALPAHLLVLRAPRGLHHDPAGVRHRLGDHPDLLAQAAVRLRRDGVRDGLDRLPVVHRLGAPHVHGGHAAGGRDVLHADAPC